MEFKEILKKQMELMGTNPNALSVAVNIKPTTIYSWLDGTIPAIDKLIPVADFFNISLDELAGRVPPQHTEQEVQLLNMFKKLPDAQKQEVLNYVDFILSK